MVRCKRVFSSIPVYASWRLVTIIVVMTICIGGYSTSPFDTEYVGVWDGTVPSSLLPLIPLGRQSTAVQVVYPGLINAQYPTEFVAGTENMAFDGLYGELRLGRRVNSLGVRVSEINYQVYESRTEGCSRVGRDFRQTTNDYLSGGGAGWFADKRGNLCGGSFKFEGSRRSGRERDSLVYSDTNLTTIEVRKDSSRQYELRAAMTFQIRAYTFLHLTGTILNADEIDEFHYSPRQYYADRRRKPDRTVHRENKSFQVSLLQLRDTTSFLGIGVRFEDRQWESGYPGWDFGSKNYSSSVLGLDLTASLRRRIGPIAASAGGVLMGSRKTFQYETNRRTYSLSLKAPALIETHIGTSVLVFGGVMIEGSAERTHYYLSRPEKTESRAGTGFTVLPVALSFDFKNVAVSLVPLFSEDGILSSRFELRLRL